VVVFRVTAFTDLALRFIGRDNWVSHSSFLSFPKHFLLCLFRHLHDPAFCPAAHFLDLTFYRLHISQPCPPPLPFHAQQFQDRTVFREYAVLADLVEDLERHAGIIHLRDFAP
jgi:hypothetical protein